MPQSFGTSGGPEAKKGRWKMLDLSATLINSWPSDCNVFLFFSRVPIWRFAAWRAKSQLPIGIFLGINILISRPIFEGPSAHNPDLKQAISATPEFAGIWASGRRRDFPFRPYLHARIPRITVVDTTPSNSSISIPACYDIIISKHNTVSFNSRKVSNHNVIIF